MRNVSRAQSFLGLLALSATFAGLNCANTADDCAAIGTLCPGQTLLTTTSSSSGDADGGVPLCEQSPRDNPSSVVDECGIFVKSGAAVGGDGSMAAPLSSLKAGIDAAKNAQKARVYACIGSYTEILKVPAGLTLYGGLDCSNGWVVVSTNSSLKGPPDKIPLTLDSGANETRIENFDVTAVDAALPGGSSIAALALDGSTVHFENSKLAAGNAQSGMKGDDAESTPPAVPPPSAAGLVACASASTNAGGSATPNVCDPDPAVNAYSVGGDGGTGKTTSGSAGLDGESNPPSMSPAGVGGKAAACAAGGDGGAGANGADGDTGAGAMGSGMLSPSAGWTGPAGADGGRGTPGQGGGGGAGQKGKLTNPTVCGGASGGAGGAGGCGGAGGKGGSAGGSSIGLVSINASITMVNVAITTAKGGAGGAGGMYQSGGMGGLGGDGGAAKTVDGIALAAGCKGGIGGNGGNGGPGGGGAGGHSVGIAYVGNKPTLDKADIKTPVDGAGSGGLGGDNNAKNNIGAAGLSQSQLEFM